jgi:hypothetical protein
MKNTSVTPSATFDAMPSPNHNVKIGASTTRQRIDHFHVRVKHRGGPRCCCANQKPTSTPATEPITKASIASTSDPEVLQMVPDKPFDDLQYQIVRRREKERRQKNDAEDRHRRKNIPRRHAYDGHHDLQKQELDVRHHQAPVG